ncbi:peptidoglycan DD-metalloendopeptidase family protein [Asticcacaulis sp. BYS171W]|uniref:Peptidoglycan DD-metalloendopeptidase family protein n=1 Tax=Asticcacaulis aquaticus TaxID=2984212 RepID=A0ABT5HXL2_9CAUL|nr:peptidoglycan DD-metalloendopeptidase family protein [Asticcacaulis aquaticus]MDC7684682.1 peptidoglycan DD-metalloendopeptidase family protein [Asticcacaulis aquaticus]
MSDLKTFLDWQSRRTELSAEVMAGLQAARPIRLDTEGLGAEGWGSDIPSGWAVVPGEPLRMGGYDEDRGIYDSDVFAGDGGERRTVHLGIDIFAPAASAVFAPVHGRVHSFQNNDNLKDYGPTIILEHAPEPEVIFWTLYGHLSRDSLDDLYIGKEFAQGDRLAALGEADVNGGWSPHLHFQLILDIGDKVGDFPGVFKRSERERWKTICPDPRPFLGMA